MRASRTVLYLIAVLLISLGFPAEAASADDASLDPPRPKMAEEQQVLQLIDDARREHKLAALTYCPELSEVAERHAHDMIERDFFSHRCPDGHTAGQRLRDAELSYRRIGENLAGHTRVQGAHDMLMQSPGHRAMITGDFDRVGLAVVRGGRYGMIMIQLFAVDQED